MRVRALLKRMGSDPLLMLAGLGTVLLAMVLLAVGPILSDAVAVSALQRSLANAPGDQSGIEISVLSAPASYDATDTAASELANKVTGSTGAVIERSIASQTYGMSTQPIDDMVDLGVLTYLDGIEDHAMLEGGRWPSDAVFELAIDGRAAEALGLDVGDELVLTPRVGGESPTEATVVGLFTLNDPLDRYWTGRELIVSGNLESSSFRSFPLVTTKRSLVVVLNSRISSTWHVRPNFARLAIDDAEPMRLGVANLESELNDALAAAAVSDGGTVSEFRVSTGLGRLLAGTGRSVEVTRSAVFAVVLQLSVLAGYSLVSISGRVVDSRRSESELFVARGASANQMFGMALAEAAVLVIPAALVAPFLSAFLLGGLDSFGPLASIDLKIEPKPTPTSFVVVAIAAVVTISLLALPARKAARAAHKSTSHRGRQRAISSGQRAGADLAVLALAGAAFWQLKSLDTNRAAAAEGRFGVDPLLVAAPALGLFAGGFLALRVVPLLARAAERLVGRRRSIMPALVGWELARRPVRYWRTALLLIMAVGIGIFAAAYDATWTQSQQDQATHQIGADARVSPNRRTNDSITDLHLTTAHTQRDGVTHSMAVLRKLGQLPNSELSAEFIAIDADAAPDVIRTRVDLIPDSTTAMATLTEARPAIGALPLPGRPTSVGLLVDVMEEEEVDAEGEPLELVFSGSAYVVLQDGNGLLHRVEIGDVVPNSGPVLLSADLTLPLPDGTFVEPVYPISIVDVVLQSLATNGPSRSVLIEFSSVSVWTDSGDVDVTKTDLAEAGWTVDSKQLGPVIQRETIGLASPRSATPVLVAIQTAVSQNPAPILFSLRPVGPDVLEAIPVLAAESWMEANGSSVGETLRLPSLQTLVDRVQIVGTIGAFPTVDPSLRDVLILDLATVQMIDYEFGRTIRPVTEHWLQLMADVDPVAVGTDLTSPPIEAVSFVGLAERERSLKTDPPALGTITALTMGFIAAACFALSGLTVSASVSRRERAAEFALLRALGLSGRQLRWLMFSEQAVVVIVSLLLGTLIGVTLSAVTLPAISLTQSGTEAFPGVLVIYPWRTIALLELAVIGLLAVVTLSTGTIRRGLAPGLLIRAGEDR